MAEHIKFEMDLIPIEEGLPDRVVVWIRRKDRGCLRQAVYMGEKDGWHMWPTGSPVYDVSHYGYPPKMGPTPCEEQQAAVLASERHN